MNMDNETRFTLRIDTQVFERVKDLAKKNKRSAAKQIEFILEDWLRHNADEELKESSR